MSKIKTKIILSAFCMMLSIFLFTACLFLPRYKFDYEDLKDEIIQIEFIEFNVASDIAYDKNSESKNYIVLKTIENEETTDNLLLDLSQLVYKQLIGDPISLHGIGIKLIHKNGEYEIFTKRRIDKYNDQNENILMQSKYCSENDFDDIIAKYAE